MKTKILGLLAVGLLAGPTQGSATTAAWDSSGGVTSYLCVGFTCGIRFTAAYNLNVSALGAQSGAFVTEGTVGLWDGAGNLLRSATISSADSLLDGYYYESVASLTLNAGAVYTVGLWVDSNSAAARTKDAINVNPYLGSLQGVFSPSGGGFAWPTNEDARLFSGANFLSERVPEPGSLALLGLGLAGLGLSRRKAN